MSAPLARAVPFRAAAVKSASRAATAPRFALAGPSHNVHCYSSSSRTSQRARLPVECSARTRPAYNARRTLATSSSQSIRDAEHPTGLWYHPLPGSSDLKRYAVSYLSQAPSSNDAQDVIAVVEVTGDSDPATFSRQNPDRVKANPAFWKLLHDTLKEDVVAGGKDAILTQEADLREDGWAHLADQRQLLMPGRIPTPDSIIASVSFANCKISPETYEVNDTHRPITKEEGWTVLRDEWLAALKARLKRQS